jgi:hypothetical protein
VLVREFQAGAWHQLERLQGSQGSPELQKLYSERIVIAMFEDLMTNFIANKPNDFVQLYFEEAHNTFLKKDEKDLTDIYNRLAKEGAKLNLGFSMQHKR